MSNDFESVFRQRVEQVAAPIVAGRQPNLRASAKSTVQGPPLGQKPGWLVREKARKAAAEAAQAMVQKQEEAIRGAHISEAVGRVATINQVAVSVLAENDVQPLDRFEVGRPKLFSSRYTGAWIVVPSTYRVQAIKHDAIYDMSTSVAYTEGPTVLSPAHTEYRGMGKPGTALSEHGGIISFITDIAQLVDGTELLEACGIKLPTNPHSPINIGRWQNRLIQFTGEVIAEHQLQR